MTQTTKTKLTLIALTLAAPMSFAQTAQPSKVIVAYVFPQNRLLQPGEIAANKITRVNYAFANIANGRIINGFGFDDKNLATLIALKQQNPALTVLVSVGGWEWSDHFSDVALTPSSRKNFIASVMTYLDQHQLDGLDIDWEYPGQAGSTNNFRPADKTNFTLLLQELRQQFNAAEPKLHRRLYLTIAAGASSSYIAHTEMAKAQLSLDTINLMAYDYYEPGDSSEPAGNHAPLFTDPADPKKVAADTSVKAFEQAGVPAEKIVLGVPFYGHQWGQVGSANHGLFQPGKPVPPGYVTYANIAATMLNQGFDRYWDSVSSAPSLYNARTKVFVSYEDPESLAAKSKYILDQHLAGVMFWEYSGDPSGVLLDTLDKHLKP